jgi:putative Holliday junction resolvase
MGLPGRVMAIDWGEARIGLALSDETRTLATPHATLHEKDKGRQVARVVALIAELEVSEVIVGLPLHMDGTDTTSTRPATKYAEKLAGLVKVPVSLVDERLTSIAAEERLAEAGRRPGRADKGRLDSAAAAVLLQGWLDARKTGHPEPDG